MYWLEILKEALIIALVAVNLTVLALMMNRLRRMMEDLQSNRDLEAMKTEIQ